MDSGRPATAWLAAPHQAHKGDDLPLSDQRRAGDLPPDSEAGREPVPFELPADLEMAAIAAFVSYNSCRRYHRPWAT